MSNNPYDKKCLLTGREFTLNEFGQYKDVETGVLLDSFVTATKGMRGHFCVEARWADMAEEEPLFDDEKPYPKGSGFYEPWSSGDMSYATNNEALFGEGKAWAEDMDLPLLP